MRLEEAIMTLCLNKYLFEYKIDTHATRDMSLKLAGRK